MENAGNLITGVIKYVDKVYEQVTANTDAILRMQDLLQSILSFVGDSFEKITNIVNTLSGIVVENSDRLDVLEMMIDNESELTFLQTEVMSSLSSLVYFTAGLGLINLLIVFILGYFLIFGKRR